MPNKTTDELISELQKARLRVKELEQQLAHHSQEQEAPSPQYQKEASQNPKEFAESIIHAMLDGFSIIDTEGVHLDVNPALCKMTGFQREELIDTGPPHLYWPPEEYGNIQQAFQKTMSGFQGNLELTFMRKSGDRFPVIICPSSITDQDGEILCYFATIKEITERKNAEEALKKSEIRYRTLVENAPVCIHEMDTQGNLISMNPKGLEMMGVNDEAQICGVHYLTAVGEKDRLHVKQLLESAFEGTTSHFEFVAETDGPVKMFASSFVPIKNAQGDIERLMGITEDITKRKQNEIELKKLSKAIEQSPTMIMITDTRGNIEYVNPTFIKTTGYTEQELIGQNPRILKSGRQDEVVFQDLWKTIQTGETWRGEFHNKKKNGEYYWEDQVISPIHNSAGELTHFVAVKEDITHRKEAEAEKAKLEAQLRRAQKLETIGTLTGGIAHDFNNILTPIMGYTEMAMMDLGETSPLHADLQQVFNSAYRARELVEQILLFSKQEERERHPILLQSLVQEALKLLRPSIPTTVEIQQDIDHSCQAVRADATQMHQVLVNLCTNAWQAMENQVGTLTIELAQITLNKEEARLSPFLHEGEYARLSVKDTGTGIDLSTQERIFEPFFTTKSTDKGTGLGLSVVHGIVRSHRGDIFVDSIPGKGSTFQIFLPTASVPAPAKVSVSPQIHKGHERILVVDDDPVVGRLIRKMLSNMGYQVTLISNSLDALKAFEQEPNHYDLLVSDLTMPNLTGIHLADAVQKLRPGFPIIITTGHRESITKEIQSSNGIKRVISKPIVMKDFSLEIRKVLDNTSSTD